MELFEDISSTNGNFTSVQSLNTKITVMIDHQHCPYNDLQISANNSDLPCHARLYAMQCQKDNTRHNKMA